MITGSNYLKLSNSYCRQQTGADIVCHLLHRAGHNSTKIRQIMMTTPRFVDIRQPKPLSTGAKIGVGSSLPPSPGIQIPIDRVEINNPA
jgi:hypothetical protein